MTDISVTVGDVIHFADAESAGVLVTDAPENPTLTVAQLLVQSRAAHRQFRVADGRINKEGKVAQQPDYSASEAAIQAALNARLIADATDPNHTDPAWAADLSEMRVSSQGLIEFYRDYLS